VAPLEHDVWSHKQMLKVVSHTPVECQKLNEAQNSGAWFDAMRAFVPEPAKLYTWWSYRAAIGRRPTRAAARPHLGEPGARRRGFGAEHPPPGARLERPSDHGR